ncbi:MAG: hypothetical protein IKP69_08130 [Oscillospiraceae bacterium]|nr:hypothetical protein [Oscillospiraceae bacterium]
MKWIQKTNIQIILLFSILLLGTAAGSVLSVLWPEWSVWSNATFRQGIGILTEQKFYCIAAPMFWLAVTAALGLSATGLSVVPLILFLRGAALGVVLKQFYTENFSFIGLLLIMPYAYITSFLMILGVREALRFSMQITGLLCETIQDDAVSVKLYIIRCVVLFIFMLIFGLLQNFLLVKFS